MLLVDCSDSGGTIMMHTQEGSVCFQWKDFTRLRVLTTIQYEFQVTFLVQESTKYVCIK
jgi:hypothetical protein